MQELQSFFFKISESRGMALPLGCGEMSGTE